MSVLIFNTSFYVPVTFADVWEEWIKTRLLPNVEASLPQLVVEVFEVVSQTGGEHLIYSVQWRCNNSEEIGQLDDLLAPELQSLVAQFGDKITHFSSVMKRTMG
ncbi:DUF4286 family protein [Alkalitalea saponilacus]|uniref:DUF4286 domain-containing protein n=1 Tax=Alkalitalea saponilacus TaxID=889453 RepID=A0A1T5A7M2_9BACT|nr:DUF4286 family protein [Alkalitalea saponilacus]ASB48817.1 hypothetical protein CDL62_06570 [Alkalitalea saponilacus]SKB30928.1 protein of unknown function [Alkalitalea saponilacus]